MSAFANFYRYIRQMKWLIMKYIGPRIRSIRLGRLQRPFLLPLIGLLILTMTAYWQPSSLMQNVGRIKDAAPESPRVSVQPAIMAASGASRTAVTFLDPESNPASQALVQGLPSNANPQGIAYFGSDGGLLADAGNSRIFVIQASTGALVSTIDTTAAGFPGSGTIAVSPDGNTALAMGGATSSSAPLFVIHAPFNGSSSISSATLPGNLPTFQTQAIVFNNGGRAFVFTIGGISVIDAPYTSVAFTIPIPNSNAGAVAITPDGNTILFSVLGTNTVGIIQAPFSTTSAQTMKTIPVGVSLDGIAIAPDGSSAIVVDNGAHQAFAISSPFTVSSAVSSIPLPPGGFDQFEDVGISADSQLAILSGGSILEPAIFVNAPFNSSSVTSSVPISGVSNTSRGRGCARFRPLTSSQVSGRATTPDGRGLRNAVVKIIDVNNVVRSTTTSSFGFYTFDTVAVGQSYTIAILSRLYRFQSRSVQVSGDLTNVDFVGLE